MFLTPMLICPPLAGHVGTVLASCPWASLTGLYPPWSLLLVYRDFLPHYLRAASFTGQSLRQWRYFYPVTAFCYKFYPELGAPAGKSRRDSSFCWVCPYMQRGADLLQRHRDTLARHFLHAPSKGQPAGLLLQFSFKRLWEVRRSQKAALQTPVPRVAGELEGTALLRSSKLSPPFASAWLSPQPLSRSALPPGSQLVRNPTVWPVPNGRRDEDQADPWPVQLGHGCLPPRRPASLGDGEGTAGRRGQLRACGALTGGRTRGSSERPCPERHRWGRLSSS